MNASSRKAKEIFVAAFRLAPDQWDSHLAEACGGDDELRSRVRNLLHANAEAGSFLEPPASEPVDTAEEPIREEPGTIIGPYKLLEQIGEGGFGVVFMAEQTQPVRRKVALKVLKPGMDTRQVVARFEAERQALALMDHVNIAKVLDAGQTGSGRPYFVMDLVKGLPITDYCDHARLTPRKRLELFVSLCQAVQHAHQKGIIHRDIKPSNVLVTQQDGTPLVKVIDFGIAKVLGRQLTDKTLFTGYAQMIGTPAYMSPEQAALSNADIDTRSDLYALGVLLYELLTGSTPLTRKRIKESALLEVLRVIREEEPPRPSTRLSESKEALSAISAQRQMDPAKLTKLVRGELDWIVMKALEKDRTRRYESASAFGADVQRYLHDEAVTACPPSAWYRFQKFGKRHKTMLTATVVVLVALIAGTAISSWQAVRATNAMNSERQLSGALKDARDESDEQAKQVRQDLKRLSEASFLMQRAKTLVDTRQWDKAHDDYCQAVELRPDHAVVWYQRGEFYSSLGLWDLAVADYARGFALRPPPAPRPWMIMALLTLYAGNTEGYQRLCQLMPAHFPTSAICMAAESEIVRAYALRPHPDADWQWAINLAKPTAELHNASTWHLMSLGAAYYRAGKYTEAQNRLAAAANNFKSVWGGSGGTYALLAMTHHQLGDAKKAHEALVQSEAFLDRQLEEQLKTPGAALWVFWFDWMFNRILYAEALTLIQGAAVPDDSRLWLIRGRSLAALQRSDQSEAALTKAAELSSKKSPVALFRYRLYANLQQWDRATSVLHESLADFIDAAETISEPLATFYAVRAAWKDLMEHFETVGRPLDAARAAQSHSDLGHVLGISRLSEAIRNETNQPRRANDYLNRAVSWERLRRWDKALADYSHVLELVPQQPVAVLVTRGQTYSKMGQWDKALADYARAIQLYPGSFHAYRGRAHAYALIGEWDKALADSNKAIQLNPKEAGGYGELAWVLTDHPNPKVRDWPRALEMAKKAVALDITKDGTYLTTVGMIYYRLGDWKAALTALEESRTIQERPWPCTNDNSLNYLFLAMTNWQLGNKEKARQLYDRAVLELEMYQCEKARLHRFRIEAAQLLELEGKSK